MAPKTVQQLFGLKPEELNALTVLSGLEGYRGGKGEDVAAVAANVLARRLKGNWGGIDIRNIAKAPGQYVAVDNYTMEQLADPNFGARILGGEAEFNRLRDIVNNPTKVAEQFQKTGGAQSFRGPSASKYMQPTDYMPVPGKSNFYFNPLDKTTYQKGVNIFGSPAPATPVAAPPPVTPAPITTSQRKQKAESLLGSVKENIVEQLLRSALQVPTVPGVFGTTAGFQGLGKLF